MKTRSPLRRVLSAAAAGALLSAVLVPASAAVAAQPDGDPLAEYRFDLSAGSAVENESPRDDASGGATVENSTDGQWTGTSLALGGGDKNGAGNWVRLPDDLLRDSASATVTTEVKLDAAMKNDYNFLWNIGGDNTEQYFFATVKDMPRTAITVGSNPGEDSAAASAGLQADRWYSLTSVLDGADGELSFYVDGRLAGKASTALTPADLTDQSLNTIGRSPWPDPLFAGEVATFRVYDRPLSAAEVEDISSEDAELHHDAIEQIAQEIIDGLAMPPQRIDADHVSLPTAGGAVTWTSSAPDVISVSGEVAQPDAGADAVDVVLTASATVRGITVTEQVRVVVEPTSASAEDRARQAADRYVVPSVMVDGDRLPEAPEGVVVTVVGAEGAQLDGDVIGLGGDEPVKARVTVAISRESAPETKVGKTFEVTVLPVSEAVELAAYHRTPTGEQYANNADIAYSMHLAVAEDGAWRPLNENYGIFFPKTAEPVPYQGPDLRLTRSLKNPSVFALADGGFGVISTRVARGGASDGSQQNSVLLATSDDLRSFDERGLIALDEGDGVNRPTAVYDSSDGQYRISWTTDSGAERHQSIDDLVSAVGQASAGSSSSGRATGSSVASDLEIEDFEGGTTLTVAASVAESLDQRFGRLSNTGYAPFDDVIIDAGDALRAESLPQAVELTYSDDSVRSLPVSEWDLSGVDADEPGTYTVTGEIKQTVYPTPLADERADPSAYRFDYNGEIKYLMIATNDPHLDNINQGGNAFMPVRIADTILGLADEAGAPEIRLLERGDTDADGRAMTGCFWAPEFHEINGRLSILFMPCYGDRPDMMTGRASIMQLGLDDDGDHLDPADPANWSKPQHVVRADGSELNDVSGISLDMTFFTDETGQSYYAWQHVCAVYIARVDPSEPTRLTSDPERIIAPEYAWDNSCAEGPNVHIRDGKAYMLYSGSSVGNTYTTGLAIADASGDLTAAAAWEKLDYPLQKSGQFDGEWQLGTGHGMWSHDEDGGLVYVFHARTDHNGLSGRDMFVRRVHFDAEGMPVLDMESSEELAATEVELRVVVRAPGGGGAGEETSPGDETTPGGVADGDGGDRDGGDLAITGGGSMAAFAIAGLLVLGAGAWLVAREGMRRARRSSVHHQ